MDNLFESCATGCVSHLSKLLNDKAGIQEWFSSLSSSSQATPLHYAAENGHLEVCRLLIEQFPEIVGLCDCQGKNALDYAVLWKRFNIIGELLSNLPKNDTDPSALALVQTYSDTELVTLGARIKPSCLGNFPSLSKCLLHAAIVENDTCLAQQILENLPTDRGFLYGQDELGWTLLHHCVSNGNVHILASLCEAGVDKAHEDYHCLTPFLLACHQGESEMLPHLIDQNPSNDIISQGIEEALKYRHLETVKEVLRLAPVHCRLSQKVWNMIVEVANQDYQRCTEVLELCPGMDEKGVILNRFLLESAKYGDLGTLMKLLSKAGVGVNFQDFLGHSALHEAVLANKSSVVNMLCQHPDTNINIQNWRGESPLHYACTKGFTSLVVQLLKQRDINVNLQDQAGRTPVLSALYWRKYHILDVFLTDEAHHQCLFLPDIGGNCTLHFVPFLPASTLEKLVDISSKDFLVSPPQKSHSPGSSDNESLVAIYSSSVEENKPDPMRNFKKLPKRLQLILKSRHIFSQECQPLCQNSAQGKPPRKEKPFVFHSAEGVPPSVCDHPLHIAVKDRHW